MSQPNEADRRSVPAWSIRRIAPYLDVPKEQVVTRAAGGDPAAFRELAADLLAFLRGEKMLSTSCGRYWMDGLEALLAEQRLWDEAADEFRKRQRLRVPIKDRITKRGPRVHEKTRRKIGNAFCSSFRLSKPQGKDANRYHFLFTPPEMWKISELRLYGASLAQAAKIVRSFYPTDLTDRQIKEWTLRGHWVSLPREGSWGFRCGQHDRRLRIATHVLHRTARGMGFEEACREVARIAVTKLCRFAKATVFLSPSVIKAAYGYATSCGDPTWERVSRFVLRAAQRELEANQRLPGTT